jgi:hypothetical protein
MADTFVPLTALTGAGAGGPETQLKVLAQAETKALFHPLTGVSEAGRAGGSCAPPSITLQRQGEIISGIRVECGCGQVIELACNY